MALVNQKNVSEFSIQGFSDNIELRLSLFIVFLSIYLFIVLGNLIVILVISVNSHLHTPMYLFLLNLSINDISSTTNILPNLLHILFTQQKNITFLGCMTQLYIFMFLVSDEYILLAIMGYDRYVAICDPLHYIERMTQKHCTQLITASLAVSFFISIPHAVLISKLFYCSSHVIDYIFCDVTPLLKISCSDTFNVELVTYIEGTLVAFNCFLLTLISYVFIILAILKIKSSDGQKKTFSTCASHLICVIIFYGTLISLYVRPASNYYPERDKFFALLYTVLIPLMNPLIYTLKNREFQSAFNKLSKKN
ncbi:olfactory receptor 1044-like [Xenopus laevis]|uniref:G-protein coupled receptors family 1 profile domain-containing protein n=2 Tax=Xenopus laevis TaxID=8355 RepID=A0A974HB17_XENLA|nr:olfactory receptor 1044-like [Xenopus laevis]OCT71402.1 hypothetical protein XELAEV_18034382mg [Xenopus laevis]